MTTAPVAPQAPPPKEPAQFIRLYTDRHERQTLLNLSWPTSHGWPPPERLAYLVGKSGANEAIVTEEGYAEMAAAAATQGREVEDDFTLTWYIRTRASMISEDDAAEMTFVARGATYIPDTTMLEIRCNGCGKTPGELDEYSPAATGSELSPEEWVIAEEGTYNDANGHFLCTPCYIDAGQPTMPGGRMRWRAP